MFTGIIESVGEVVELVKNEGNIELKVRSVLTPELHINQSISHNGVCLTVTDISKDIYSVTIIDETIKKTSLAELKSGDFVNLERCMPANGRFDGHIVQGHVDQIGVCTSIEDANGSYIFTFSYNEEQGNITVEKGSICINGISLTVFNSKETEFSVAIIPYTLNHTNLKYLKIGMSVNLEFDILGKYIKKILNKYN
jgi:riboflavin synthase